MELISGIKRYGKNMDIPIVTFKSLEDLAWLGCGFSTRLGGVSKSCFSSMNMSFCRGDDPVDVMENIRLFSEAAGFMPQNIVMPHQCHTTNVQIVGKNECGRGIRLSLLKSDEATVESNLSDEKNRTVLTDKPGTEEEVDGQITDEQGVVLYVLGADCVPIFIVDTAKKIISAIHAGWRGTVGDIVSAAIRKMKVEFGCDTKDMRAVIGPSICQDCYEVSKDVADLFLEKYGGSFYKQDNNIKVKDSDNSFEKIITIVRPASGDFGNNPTEKYYLNLWETNRLNLINAGIDSDKIEISGHCTRCHPNLFFSHRAHGNDRGVNIGYIYIKSIR